MLIEQDQLRHEHRPQGEQRRALQALHRHRHPPRKDVLGPAVVRFDGLRAQLVKPFPDLDAAIAMGVRASSGGHQLTAAPVTRLPQVRGVVLGITQHRAHVSRELPQPPGRHFMVTPIRHGQLGGQRDPDGPHGHGQMQFPAVPPAMPAGFTPPRFRIHGTVGDEALLAMLFVPHTPAGRQRCAIEGHGATLRGPRAQPRDQVPPSIANQAGQARRQQAQAAFPGAAAGKAAVCSHRRGRHGAATASSWSRNVSQA
jgi:hypothetical protein